MKKEVGKRIDVTTEITVVSVSKDLEIKSKGIPKEELKYGEIDVVVSNSGEDRHGEKIIMEGIDISQVKRNPTVLWAHEYADLSIGKITKLWKDSGNLMARIHFAYDLYEFAHTVYKMVVGGYLNAVSIGGVVREFGMNKEGFTDYSVIKDLEMVELSVVPVGAHPDALVVQRSIRKELGISKKEIREQYRNAFSKIVTLDKFKNMTENDKNKYLSSLKELVGILEGVEPVEPIEVKEKQEPKVREIGIKIINK